MKMNVTRVLAGRRESELLAFPSVQRMTDILAERCREPSWIRTSIATLERFRAMTGQTDLEALLAQARGEPEVAEQALAAFALALSDYTESQVSALAMGAKIWFRLNGVNVPWRPLPGNDRLTAGLNARPTASTPGYPGVGQKAQAIELEERALLLGLIGSGLQMAELLRLRVGDVGSLDGEGHLIPDLEADPLAVQYTPRRGNQGERITFFTYAARQALLRLPEYETWYTSTGQLRDAEAPLFGQSNSTRAGSASVARARRRSQALIRAGNEVNVALCRATGDFFREWGLPGSRFEGVDDLNIEEYI
jgi:hypothetical protein